jgi:hypothetical protein
MRVSSARECGTRKAGRSSGEVWLITLKEVVVGSSLQNSKAFDTEGTESAEKSGRLL